MKKISVFLIMIVMIQSLVACGKTNVDVTKEEKESNITQSTDSKKENENSDLASVLEKITTDVTDFTVMLTQKLEETFEKVGTTYEDYQKNKGIVDEWIELVFEESEELFARIREKSIVYFKLIVADPDHKYSEFCDDALEEYYDIVYDEAMEEYYDEIYDKAMEDLYDEYYDGIVDDAYDELEYSEWSNASSECYKIWSNASSDIYKMWSNESSYIYGLWSAMNSAFCWNDNYDVDAIVANYEAKIEDDDEMQSEEFIEESMQETSEFTQDETETIYETDSRENDTTVSETQTDTNNENGIRTEFKEAMDSYEAFYKEYCDFMKTYNENPNDWKLLAEYAKMLLKLNDMNTAFEAWNEEELNDEELKYYLDVNNRVAQMLLEIE